MIRVRCPKCGRPVLEGRARRIDYGGVLFEEKMVQGGRFVVWDDGRMRHTPRSEPAPVLGYQLHQCSKNPGEAEVWRERARQESGNG